MGGQSSVQREVVEGTKSNDQVECDKATTFKILDYFFEQEGNFIDTYVISVDEISFHYSNHASSANLYQNGESEEWLGEWMAERKNRDQLVVATKYTSLYLSGKGGETIKSNFQGNHAKSLQLSLTASLEKLQTSYVDLVSWRVLTQFLTQDTNSMVKVLCSLVGLYHLDS